MNDDFVAVDDETDLEFDEAYFDEARTMFLTTGYRNLMAEVDEMEKSCTLDTCDDEKSLWYQKGRLSMLRWLQAYESSTLEMEKTAEADAREDSNDPA